MALATSAGYGVYGESRSRGGESPAARPAARPSGLQGLRVLLRVPEHVEGLGKACLPLTSARAPLRAPLQRPRDGRAASAPAQLRRPRRDPRAGPQPTRRWPTYFPPELRRRWHVCGSSTSAPDLHSKSPHDLRGPLCPSEIHPCKNKMLLRSNP